MNNKKITKRVRVSLNGKIKRITVFKRHPSDIWRASKQKVIFRLAFGRHWEYEAYPQVNLKSKGSGVVSRDTFKNGIPVSWKDSK